MAPNLTTEALARRCARRPWATIAIWVVVFVVAGFLVATFLKDGETTKFVFVNNPEAQRGMELLEDRLRGPTGTNEVVVVQSGASTVDEPSFQRVVSSLTDAIAALGPEYIRLETLANYYQTGAGFLVSGDRHTTIIPFTMAGDFDDGSDHIKRVVEVVSAFQGQADFKVLMTGQATAGLDFRELGQEALETGEAFGVPIAAVILIAVLGAVVAALVPLILAAVSIVVALGVAALVGQAFELSFFVENIITMIGLAVGIDYSLFVVSRYREERAGGLEKIDAIGRAGATATRAVVFSGMTVVLGLFGMFLIPFNIFMGIGAGAIFVVLAAMLASMTLLPALLGLFGDGINKLSIPVIGRVQARFNENRPGGFWDKVSKSVMRQPVISLVLAAGILVAAALPFFDLRTGFAGVTTLPDRIESKQAFLILDEEFSAGEVTPAEIVIDGEVASPLVQGGVRRLTTLLRADEAFSRPRPLEVNAAGDLALLSVSVKGDSSTEESLNAVKRLRKQYVPEAFAGVPAEVHVTGEIAFNIDFFDLAKDSAWIVFPFVLGVSFLLLIVVFRSIIVPIKAIILNLLSVGAAYGLLVLVFQKGWLNSQLGLMESPIIEAWIPLFLFSILFGLSMDYHVFLLSRIRERFDQTGNNTESVAFGIRSTGRLITGAALIMVAVFWGFAAGDLVGLQQMGFGLGVAILVDATIVRSVLVPASMRLLGKWNWYLPGWLGWLPDLRVAPAKEAVAPGASND
jgi:RND superfamily putative drug exporter